MKKERGREGEGRKKEGREDGTKEKKRHKEMGKD